MQVGSRLWLRGKSRTTSKKDDSTIWSRSSGGIARFASRTTGTSRVHGAVVLCSAEGYTIFGFCEPMSVIETLTATPTDGGDKPLTTQPITSVDVTRCP